MQGDIDIPFPFCFLIENRRSNLSVADTTFPPLKSLNAMIYPEFFV